MLLLLFLLLRHGLVLVGTGSVPSVGVVVVGCCAAVVVGVGGRGGGNGGIGRVPVLRYPYGQHGEGLGVDRVVVWGGERGEKGESMNFQ